MSEVVLWGCKELINDDKLGYIDLIFKDICLEIHAKRRLVLTNEEFKDLTSCAAERINELMVSGSEKQEYAKSSIQAGYFLSRFSSVNVKSLKKLKSWQIK